MISRYQSSLMKHLWSDSHKYRTWFKVEQAYLKAYFEHHGRADRDLFSRLKQAQDRVDWLSFSKRVLAHEDLVKHDLIAFLQVLEEELGADARFVHHGLTSSDVVDTSLALILKESALLIEQALVTLLISLFNLAKRHRGLACLGRTHGQAAEVTSFAIKLLGHFCEIGRSHQRLQVAIKDIAVGKFSGAVGTFAYSHPEIEKNALAELGLSPETVATQVVARDRHAAYFTVLACLAGSLERLAVEIRLLMHGQVAEVSEAFSQGQKGSSAMPHKKNPIGSENISGLMRMLRSYALAALENQALWHERDISHSSVERIIGPDATSLIEFAIKRLGTIIDGLVINQQVMAANLAAAGNTIYSQGLMLALVDKGLMRQQAYELVQKAAQSTGSDFIAQLKKAGIEEYISEPELATMFSPAQLLRWEGTLFERARESLSHLTALQL